MTNETNRRIEASRRALLPDDDTPADDSVKHAGPTLDEARQAIAAAKQQAVTRCQQELHALLQKHNCALASYQELVNGVPKTPAQIIVVAND